MGGGKKKWVCEGCSQTGEMLEADKIADRLAAGSTAVTHDRLTLRLSLCGYQQTAVKD